MGTFNDDIGPRLVAYFKKRLGAFNYKGGWLKCDCPHPGCGKENKFGINIGLDKTNCFVCETKVKPLDLILQLEGFETKKELYGFIKNLDDVDPFETRVKAIEQKEVNWPESFKLLNQGVGMVPDLARSYMRGRGFKVIDLTLKGVGYCTTGKYANCIILPFFAEGKLIYFIGRKFIASDQKFQNPEKEEFGIGKSQLIYNADALYYYKRVHVVESYINALTLGDRAIATLGKSISNYQKSMILRSPVEEVDIILDPDAYLQSLQTALDFSMYKKVRIVKLPEGKDVNDIGRKETRSLIKAFPLLTYQDVYKLFLFEKNKVQYEQSYSGA